MTTVLKEGDPAPDVTLETPEGGHLPLSAMRGGTLVLFFYPKDDTTGCTAEALDFSALKAAFELEGAHILGVSKGTSAGKSKFIDKHGLKVALATDADGSACEAFGTWVEKSMYGKTHMGIERSTFLIDPEGRIARSWRGVKVAGHADAVLEAVRELKGKREPHAG